MQKKLLTNGNINQLATGRWVGVVWYRDEQGERKRRSFSGKTKTSVNRKITDYIADFNTAIEESDEAKKRLADSMRTWLRVFKFPSIERTTYDRYECTAENQIYPVLGNKTVGDITAADIKSLLNQKMCEGYAYTTVKKVYSLLNEYFKYLMQQEAIPKNPMQSAPMIKKANFFAAQDKENLPIPETVTIFTPDEIERFKAEAFKRWGTGKRLYRQSAAFILMLNTGLRTGEALGLLNSDIDLDKRVMHVQRGTKEVISRDGLENLHQGSEMRIGKLKSASSKRDVPLNSTAVAMIEDLRSEAYFGEDTPLICDETGGFTRPMNFRKRYYRILDGARLEKRGLHSLRHTFASTLVNGIKQPDGTIKALSPKQVADLLGHSTSQITETYYVRKDTSRLNGITDGFEM